MLRKPDVIVMAAPTAPNLNSNFLQTLEAFNSGNQLLILDKGIT